MEKNHLGGGAKCIPRYVFGGARAGFGSRFFLIWRPARILPGFQVSSNTPTQIGKIVINGKFKTSKLLWTD